MNALQTFAERLLGYAVDWNATAAWVQAFGSVLALFIAIEVPRRAERQRRQAFRQTVLTYAKTIDQAVAVASIYGPEESIPSLEADPDVAGLELKLRSLIRAVERLPLDQLEDETALDATLRLVGAATTFVRSHLGPSLTRPQGEAVAMNKSTPQKARERVSEQLARLEAALAGKSIISSILDLQRR